MKPIWQGHYFKHCFIPEKCSFLLLESRMVMHLCRSFYAVFLCLGVWHFVFHAFPAQFFSHLVTRYLFERCLHETPSLAFGCKCCQGRDHICLLHSFLPSTSQSLCIVGPEWIFVEWMTPWINKAHEPWACQLPFLHELLESSELDLFAPHMFAWWLRR